MSRRHVSLYFSSITNIATVRFFLCWIFASFLPTKFCHFLLRRRVKKYFGENVDVFAFSSGRGALAACLKACDVGTGDNVVLSSYTCLAVPTAVIANNATPSYCDVEDFDFNVNPDKIISKCKRENVKAVVVQHTMGCASDVNSVMEYCRPKKIFVIEDCALSVGSIDKGSKLGTKGDAAIISMELSKTISTGWGGVLVVKNAQLRERLLVKYRDVPITSWMSSTKDMLQSVICGISYHPYIYTFIGKYLIYFCYKFRLFRISTSQAEINGNPSNDFVSKLHRVQAMFAISQWKRLDRIAIRSDANYKILSEALKAYGFILPCRNGNQSIIVSPRISFLVTNVNETISFFSKRNIEIGLWFDGPLSPLPESNLFCYDSRQFPNSTIIAKHVVNLPCHSRLSNKDIQHILQVLEEFTQLQPWNIYRP